MNKRKEKEIEKTINLQGNQFSKHLQAKKKQAPPMEIGQSIENYVKKITFWQENWRIDFLL